MPRVPPCLAGTVAITAPDGGALPSRQGVKVFTADPVQELEKLAYSAHRSFLNCGFFQLDEKRLTKVRGRLRTPVPCPCGLALSAMASS